MRKYTKPETRKPRAKCLRLNDVGITKEQVEKMGYCGPEDETLMVGFYIRNHFDFMNHKNYPTYYAKTDGSVYHITRQGRAVKISPVYLNADQKFYLIISPFNYEKQKTESITLHKFIYESFAKVILPPRTDVHHKDFNPLNNSYFNLMAMDEHEHMKLHAQLNSWKAQKRKEEISKKLDINYL